MIDSDERNPSFLTELTKISFEGHSENTSPMELVLRYYDKGNPYIPIPSTEKTIIENQK
jgi:hypothetical protein